MLRTIDVVAGYGEINVLQRVSLEIPTGVIAVLMGPNGAGKSTLLRSIFNLTTISEGKILYGNTDITRFPTHRLVEMGLAFVSQGKINFGTLSVRDNLLLGAYHIRNENDIRKALTQVETQFPILKKKANHHAFTLSGGEQQMLAIGRALMSQPRFLLLDEPSLGLSPKLVQELFVRIAEIRDAFHTTIVIVEHNLKSLLTIADIGFVMVEGKIVAQGSCATLKDSAIMKQVFVGKYD